MSSNIFIGIHSLFSLTMMTGYYSSKKAVTPAIISENKTLQDAVKQQQIQKQSDQPKFQTKPGWLVKYVLCKEEFDKSGPLLDQTRVFYLWVFSFVVCLLMFIPPLKTALAVIHLLISLLATIALVSTIQKNRPIGFLTGCKTVSKIPVAFWLISLIVCILILAL